MTPSPHRTAPLWTVAPGLAAFALLAWRFDWLCDDAYISFRYAAHLAAGEGLRYNLGDAPPVEGYSNFLWVVALAGLRRAGLEMLLGARLLSALCGALLVVWTTRHATRRLALAPAAAALFGLFVGTLPPLAIWATGGLAAMPTALFVFGAYERLLGDPARPRGLQAGLCAVLAALVRADGALWVAMVLGAGALVWWLEGRPAALFRALLVALVVVVIGVTMHVTWRISYYGDYVPNTARVKAGFSTYRLGRGLDYVAAYFLALPGLALALLSALRRWDRGLCTVWIPALAVVTGTLCYAVWVGGDFMPMGRFLMPAIPFAALLFAGALQGQRLRPSGAFLGLACVGLSLAAAFGRDPVPADVRARFHFRADRAWESELDFWRGMRQRARDWDLQGRALARVVQPGESIVLGAMGALGYYSGLTVYDTYGLVTPEVHRTAEVTRPASPGHDLRVGPEALLHHRPTYLGVLPLMRVDEPLEAGIPEAWRARVQVERHPLPPELGLPPGVELRVLRLLD